VTDAATENAMVYTARGTSVRYGGVLALDRVDFGVAAGEVHAMVGANGAGKSSLVKVLCGTIRPTAGGLLLDGNPVSFSNGREAVAAGIATVSQELTLFEDLTVLENLFLMREPRLLIGTTDRHAMREAALPVLDLVGVPERCLRWPLRALSLSAQQLVEIARAMLEDPKVLILDEPTSALKAHETRRLMAILDDLRSRGVAIIFVSHFLEDVFEIADVVTVLRNGRTVSARAPRASLTPQSVIDAMLGSSVQQKIDRDEARKGRGGGVAAARLEAQAVERACGPLVVSGLSGLGITKPVSLRAEPGEVVGLAGAEGSGSSETLRILFGQRKLSGGTITLPTGRSGPRSMNAAVRAGVAYVPADRKTNGLVLDASIFENVSMVTAGPLKRSGLLPRRSAKIARTRHWKDALGLTMSTPRAPAKSLSGGNQQKVVFAKWLDTAPSLILLDDPTRGVDVAAKADMMRLIREIAEAGRVVLYASSDLQEMAQLCDRIVVFYRGGVVGELNPPFREHDLLDAITTGTTSRATTMSLQGEPRP
jgi:ABC-type sugar transport system ATPase subunit